MLAAMAEMAMWEGEQEDRSVVDTVIEEFSQRMGELAEIIAETYKAVFDDFIITM